MEKYSQTLTYVLLEVLFYTPVASFLLLPPIILVESLSHV